MPRPVLEGLRPGGMYVRMWSNVGSGARSGWRVSRSVAYRRFLRTRAGAPLAERPGGQGGWNVTFRKSGGSRYSRRSAITRESEGLDPRHRVVAARAVGHDPWDGGHLHQPTPILLTLDC